MFGLVMCEDRISMQGRRREIIQGMRKLPGIHHSVFPLLMLSHTSVTYWCSTLSAFHFHEPTVDVNIAYGRPHLIHNLLLPSLFLHWYWIVLLSDRGMAVWTTCPELLLNRVPFMSQIHESVTLPLCRQHVLIHNVLIMSLPPSHYADSMSYLSCYRLCSEYSLDAVDLMLIKMFQIIHCGP